MLQKNNIPLKYIIGKIKYGLILVSIYAMVVALFYYSFHFTRITIPLSVPMILGTVLSLLLGFRSNQAYDRWWEARIIWGAIVNDSRTLARQILTFVNAEFEGEEMIQFKERFIRRQMGWNYALKSHLRNQSALKSVKGYVIEDEHSYLSRYTNVPTAILELHGRDIRYALNMGWINEYQQVELDRTISRLCDSMGKCERIKNTVFPSTYSLYIHFALNLFILMLPYALIEYFGMMVIPMVIAIAATFMLIEKMAIHLQDPFDNKPTDTPMTTLSKNIERDLRQMLNEYHIIDEVEQSRKESFYVM
ncbi:MAG TPA: bestrophin family ion channel [Flavipsychrobacter sp.]|nr:bestrophin family ion channel [Flavipsychrobacter sp.]